MNVDRRSSRTLLLGLFSAGLFYTFLVIIQGRWNDLGVIIAAFIEMILICVSLGFGPPNKKGLMFIALVIIIFTISAVLFGFLSEIVLMANGGLVIYAFVMSEPKFPLTKRALTTGVVVGIIYTFLGIYLALKLGVVYFIGAEMVGAMILTAKGQYTPEENTIVVAIANGSAMISMGVLITFPAIAIFEPEIAPSLITYEFIAFVTGASAIFGLLILAPFRDRFEDAPWPQVKPQAQCINSLAADSESKKNVLMGMAASGAWMATTKAAESVSGASLSSFPKSLEQVVPAMGAVPDWVGMTNSPLIASIGFFVGWKRTMVVMIGSLASLLIWIVLEGAQTIEFGMHLHRPEILYLALGTFASVIVGELMATRKNGPNSNSKKDSHDEIEVISEKQDNLEDEDEEPATLTSRGLQIRKVISLSVEGLRREIHEMVDNPREYLRSRRGQLPPWIAIFSVALFVIIAIIIFWFVTPFAGLQINWLLFIFGGPLALLSAYFTARAICETGMLAGYLSDMLAIPAIIFFRVSFAAITTFISMLGALQDAAVALLVHLKLGKLTGVRGKDITKAVFVGAILGTTVGSLIIYMIYILYGFGGTEFPSPAAQIFGFLVIGLTGLGNLQLPGLDQFPGWNPVISFLYLLSFGITGAIAGRELNRRGLSAMSLAVG
ncbi:MAG: OPT/YSL family transporter, partial [Candidatus Thorarchaeota archaeon]